MRSRDYRRHQSESHMWRRLKEDRNQHYNDLSCPCWTDKKAMARFKEQPKVCSKPLCCGNQRQAYGPTRAELKNYITYCEEIDKRPHKAKFKG